MNGESIKKFMTLGGQHLAQQLETGDEARRKLGAQLLLSEVLEYVIAGLGVIPEVNGTKITNANTLQYHAERTPDKKEMIDGLADTAYTMYWNMLAFGVPLEQAFDMVCQNNLEKFIRLENWKGATGALPKASWDCGCGVSWPAEVVKVEVLNIGREYFAVGKDERGKVRKPSNYKSVDLSCFLSASA